MPPSIAEPPGGRRPTIREVAIAAGVSRQTVSNTLNAADRVAPVTRDRVLATIARLGYAPNEAARSLTSRLTRTVTVSVGHPGHDPSAIEDPFLHALVREAGRRDYRVIVVDRGDDDTAEVTALGAVWTRRATDGVILADTHNDDRRPALLAALGVPLVAFGTPWGEHDVAHDWIDIDGAEGMRLTVDHMIERGHDRIGFVGWQPDGAGGDVRAEAWTHTMRRSGLDPARRVHAVTDAIDAGRASAADLLRRSDRPTAITCASDSLAFGACQAVVDAGLTPGIDVAVSGYDDSVIASIARPALTSVRQPLAAVAEFLIETIELRSARGAARRSDPVVSGDDADEGPRSRMIPPSLVVRASSAAAAPRDDPRPEPLR